MRSGIAVVLARNLVGLSQSELASSTKVGQRTIRKLELGENISEVSIS